MLGKAQLSLVRFKGDARIDDSRYIASAGKSVVWHCTSQSLADSTYTVGMSRVVTLDLGDPTAEFGTRTVSSLGRCDSALRERQEAEQAGRPITRPYESTMRYVSSF